MEQNGICGSLTERLISPVSISTSKLVLGDKKVSNLNPMNILSEANRFVQFVYRCVFHVPMHKHSLATH